MTPPNATPAPRPLAQPPLTMKASTEWHLRATYGKGPLFAELDATRVKLAEMDAACQYHAKNASTMGRELEETQHELGATLAKLAQAEALRATSEAQLASLSPKLTDAESRVAALTEAIRSYLNHEQGSSTQSLRAALSPSQDAKEAQP